MDAFLVVQEKHKHIKKGGRGLTKKGDSLTHHIKDTGAINAVSIPVAGGTLKK